jgi:hypothetical protein
MCDERHICVRQAELVRPVVKAGERDASGADE